VPAAAVIPAPIAYIKVARVNSKEFASFSLEKQHLQIAGSPFRAFDYQASLETIDVARIMTSDKVKTSKDIWVIRSQILTSVYIDYTLWMQFTD
jgi:hypothetical protein